jgi:di/tripeptidase
MEIAHSKRNPADEAELDAEFHLAIIEASHNVIMLHMMRSMFQLLREGVFYNRKVMFKRRTTRGALLDQHRAINAALQARDPDAARRAVEVAARALEAEYGLLETKALIELRPLGSALGEWRGTVPPFSAESAERVLSVLISLPHGPFKCSHAVPGLVETSNNVAAVTTDVPAMLAAGGSGGAGGGSECVRVLCSSRSSVDEAMAGVRDKLVAIAKTMGKGAIELTPAYPGWRPNPKSKLLEITKAKLSAQLKAEGINEPPHVLAIHAGLECGLIGEKCSAAYGGGPSSEMDLISFGPTIRGAHSPDEAVEIATVPKFYQLTKAVLAELAAVRSS